MNGTTCFNMQLMQRIQKCLKYYQAGTTSGYIIYNNWNSAGINDHPNYPFVRSDQIVNIHESVKINNQILVLSTVKIELPKKNKSQPRVRNDQVLNLRSRDTRLQMK